MRSPDRHEIALLELMAMQPPSFLPPHVLVQAKAMHKKGLVVIEQDRWYPTALGLMTVGRVLH